MSAGPAPLRAAAPAKVNLGLRVTGRRADGYHELESLFAPLDLADEVEVAVERGSATRVELCVEADASIGPVPTDDRNLAARAAHAFLEAAGLRRAVRVRLAKRIPAGAGLGGGSSDAGAVLRGLAQLLPDAVAPADLAALALALGADVPFFLDPRPALVSGIGERLRPLDGLAPLALVLANPRVALSTAEVYAVFDALGPPPPRRPGLDAWRAALDGARPEPAALAALLTNDLEPAALRLCPPIARLRRALEATDALGTGLSGSGPTVYAVFADRAQAECARARAELPAGTWTRVASLLAGR